jgi:hypothetical protein
MNRIKNGRRGSQDVSVKNPLKFFNSPKFSMKMQKICSFDSELTRDDDKNFESNKPLNFMM